MGIEISQTEFSQLDYDNFGRRLQENLASMDRLLEDPEFGEGPASLGAEMEIYVVDSDGHPLYANQEILSAAADPQLTLELNRYNLEYNLSPSQLSDSAFAATEQEILDGLARLRSVAAQFDGRIVPIGILPTLRKTDFGSHCITDMRRYHALVNQLIKRRGDKFHIDIHGADPLKIELEDITLEGANTSFQVHYRVRPADYAETFNAVQLVTPLAVAIGANSPTLFGHRLWQETRIPLFKQSIDTRHVDRYRWREPARVNYGQGWVRRGVAELFHEFVRIYPPLLPVCAHPTERHPTDEAPPLSELRLHQGTVWLWNRPIYDDADGGHFRIEMRALPAGPTAVDMVANAAFVIGLAEGIRPQLEKLLPALPFSMADYNFHRAAQHGLDARLVWPGLTQNGYRERGVVEIIGEMLPLAREGLDRIGVSAAESRRYLNIIDGRLKAEQTGASWQLHQLSQLRQTMPLHRAQHELLERFMQHSEVNLPVAEWPL